MAKNKTNGRVQVLHGSSLIRPITRPNDCRSARIAFHWCLCDYQAFEPNDTKSISPQLMSFMMDYITNRFKVKQDKIECLRFNFREVAVRLNEGRRLFYIKLLTKRVADRTKFEGYVELEKDGTGRFVGRLEP